MKIIYIIWKDTLLRFSDRMEILFFLVLPVIFTFMLSGGGAQPAEAGARLLVVDQDQSSLSGELIRALGSSGAVQVDVLALKEAEQQFRAQKAPAWVVIPGGFAEQLLAAGLESGQESALELHRLPGSSDADAAQQALAAAVSTVNRSLAAGHTSLMEAERLRPFSSDGERQAYFNASLAAAQEMYAAAPQQLMVTRPEQAHSESYDPAVQAATGQLITWVFIPLLATSGIFAFERSKKTLARLLVTPTRKATLLLGVVAGQLSIALVQMVILILVGIWLLDVSWGRSLAGLAVMMVAFGLASVALGVMLGTFIKTEKQAGGLSTMLGMVMALLGGCWWPAELFPPAVRSASVVLPTTWAMRGLNDLALRGQSLVEILPTAGVLLGFAVVFFLAGLRRLRFE